VIYATDGAIGHVRGFYLDDRARVVRYLVVEIGSWLSGTPESHAALLARKRLPEGLAIDETTRSGRGR
jgi:hypothetical protein